MRFERSYGPVELEIRPEHFADGEWVQGEVFTLRIGYEAERSLPDAQEHRFAARVVHDETGARYQNGLVRVLVTPVS